MRHLANLLLAALLLLATACHGKLIAQPSQAPAPLAWAEDRPGTVGLPASAVKVVRVVDDKLLLLQLSDPADRLKLPQLVVWRGPTAGYRDQQVISWRRLLGEGGAVRVVGNARFRLRSGGFRTYLVYERYVKPAGGIAGAKP